MFSGCTSYVWDHPPTTDQWRRLAEVLNAIVGAADADLDNAACTCFLENLAEPDHPLRPMLTGEALAFWKNWES